MKALNFVIGFISGAAIGATCGLLFAPEKGSDLREKIAEALRKRGIRLNRQEMADWWMKSPKSYSQLRTQSSNTAYAS